MKTDLLSKILNSGLIDDQDTSFLIYDLDQLEHKFKQLKNAFPENSLHTLATKACPLLSVLKFQNGFQMGAECASLEEVMLALHAGIPADSIIYNGPVKTPKEINFCLKSNIYLNANTLDELDLIASLNGEQKPIGLRLNPLTGAGLIAMTSVAGQKSKFGAPISQVDEIQRRIHQYPYLTGLHVHVGSQGMTLADLVAGVARTLEIAEKYPQIKVIDIGGGLSAKYRASDPDLSFSDYTKALKREVPQLFSGKYKILTEFGRSIFAPTAVAISQIESVTDQNQIYIHLGADFLLRKIYRPTDWFHQISVCDESGKELENNQRESQTYSVVGPLCFSGDVLQESILLPRPTEKDFILIKDVGAYTMSMWSRHCSRALPKVFGVYKSTVCVLKQRESIDDIIRFWT